MTKNKGVTVAGVAIYAADTGRVFLAKRVFDKKDKPAVRETYEFPGGHLEPGEDPFVAAQREFLEEIMLPFPVGKVDGTWSGGEDSADEHYQGFVYCIPVEFSLEGWEPTSEVQAIGWFDSDQVTELESSGQMRPEIVATMDWSLIWPVSGNHADGSEYDMTDTTIDEPVLDAMALAGEPLQFHGVLAPEDTESGDKRGFNAGSVTARPTRLPFSWQKISVARHDGSVVVGSLDRLMRKDGMIHYQGTFMDAPEADEFAGVLAHFGKFGVSVDGDMGSLDEAKTAATGMVWYDAVRAAGLTAVAIPAFHEAYVAFGPHPDMPEETDDQFAVMVASGDLVAFRRGPGWATNPAATKRIHDYWMPGHPGGDKIAWGTPGDFTRAKRLIGEKIGLNSPSKLRFLNQIIAQWHHDALGYWPGDLGKPGNAPDTPENRRRAARHAHSVDDMLLTFRDVSTKERKKLAKKGAALSDGSFPIANCSDLKNAIQAIGRAKDPAKAKAHIRRRKAALGCNVQLPDTWGLIDEAPPKKPTFEAEWSQVLTSSADGSPTSTKRALPPISYFTRHPETDGNVIEEPDEFGLRRTHGYAGEWGICHVGHDGRCTEVPMDPNGGTYPWFHLGRTKVVGEDGEPTYVHTGLITYGKQHRSAQEILSETPTQAHFDDLRNAWAAVVLGEDERGVWYSGVVLPTVEDKWLTAIEASGQVSGEWKRGELRTLLTVNVAGFPVMRSSAAYDEDGTLLALSASALSMPFEVCEPPEDAICGYVDAAGVKCAEHATWGVWLNPDAYELCCPDHVESLQSEHECVPTPAERIAALALIDAEDRIQKTKALFALES